MTVIYRDTYVVIKYSHYPLGRFHRYGVNDHARFAAFFPDDSRRSRLRTRICDHMRRVLLDERQT